METLDLTRDHAVVRFDAAPAYRVGPPGGGDALLRQITDFAVLALAAEQVGGTEKVLEMAVDYAKVRHQFDRPIGSFQAVKHTCAQILLTLESARTLVEHAAWIADQRPGLLPAAAAACGSTCSEAFATASYDALHIHGGLGFTWEHPAHLYFRRARSDERLFGSPDTHRERLAAYVTGHSG
jgi:alkylation response protein AidB-like acyl-CoA dehydrogenase